MKYVPDSSVLINGQFLKYLSKQSDISSIILSRVVLAEIENMANQAKATGRRRTSEGCASSSEAAA